MNCYSFNLDYMFALFWINRDLCCTLLDARAVFAIYRHLIALRRVLSCGLCASTNLYTATWKMEFSKKYIFYCKIFWVDLQHDHEQLSSFCRKNAQSHNQIASQTSQLKNYFILLAVRLVITVFVISLAKLCM